jgi:hypothetical protein
MSKQPREDFGTSVEVLLTVAVLLAIVGTGVVVLVYGPQTGALVGEATQTVAPAAASAPPADYRPPLNRGQTGEQ